MHLVNDKHGKEMGYIGEARGAIDRWMEIQWTVPARTPPELVIHLWPKIKHANKKLTRRVDYRARPTHNRIKPLLVVEMSAPRGKERDGNRKRRQLVESEFHERDTDAPRADATVIQ